MEESLFGSWFQEVLVHGHLAPLPWDCGEAEQHGGGAQ